MKPLAIVTGASRGIGRHIAEKLVQREDCEVLLVARHRAELEQVAASIHSQGGDASVFTADLTQKSDRNLLVEYVRNQGRPLTWLVNNAGIGLSGDFAQHDPERLERMLQLNVVALSDLTSRLLPLIPEDGKILNVASSAGFAPLQNMAAYAASKAFVIHLSMALYYELADRGITVTALCPGPVETDFFAEAMAQKPPRVAMENPSETADQAITGALEGRMIVTSSPLATSYRYISQWVPTGLLARLRF